MQQILRITFKMFLLIDPVALSRLSYLDIHVHVMDVLLYWAGGKTNYVNKKYQQVCEFIMTKPPPPVYKFKWVIP